jgi:DNA modification methylase
VDVGAAPLIRGDATDTVKRLMDGRKANLVLTDPPYNVSFESASGLKIKNDSMKAEQCPIKNSSQANGIVLDAFGGSGSTLIACEQADRICNMLELDEKYASVILRRYAEFKQNGGEDITCECDGKMLRYTNLVKEVAARE